MVGYLVAGYPTNTLGNSLRKQHPLCMRPMPWNNLPPSTTPRSVSTGDSLYPSSGTFRVQKTNDKRVTRIYTLYL